MENQIMNHERKLYFVNVALKELVLTQIDDNVTSLNKTTVTFMRSAITRLSSKNDTVIIDSLLDCISHLLNDHNLIFRETNELETRLDNISKEYGNVRKQTEEIVNKIHDDYKFKIKQIENERNSFENQVGDRELEIKKLNAIKNPRGNVMIESNNEIRFESHNMDLAAINKQNLELLSEIQQLEQRLKTVQQTKLDTFQKLNEYKQKEIHFENKIMVEKTRVNELRVKIESQKGTIDKSELLINSLKSQLKTTSTVENCDQFHSIFQNQIDDANKNMCSKSIQKEQDNDMVSFDQLKQFEAVIESI
jgi:chromosome segregation ATPase